VIRGYGTAIILDQLANNDSIGHGLNNLMLNENLNQGGQVELQSAALLTQKTREFKIGNIANINNFASKIHNDGAEHLSVLLNDKKARQEGLKSCTNVAMRNAREDKMKITGA